MRRMSFALTERQFLDGSKTITRRLGWQTLRAGDELIAVRKAMGLARGESQHVLGRLRVISTQREPLFQATMPGEAAREGFPELTGPEFVRFFCRTMGCAPASLVTRIEFLRLADTEEPAYSGVVMGAFRYSTEGPRRGRCGHQHKSIASAVDCLDADMAWCRERGVDADRRIFVLGNRHKRELNEEELAEVAAYRATAKPTP